MTEAANRVAMRSRDRGASRPVPAADLFSLWGEV